MPSRATAGSGVDALLPARHRGSDDPTTVKLARIEPLTHALGPGARVVGWVQGCALACEGCVVPESHATGGEPWPVDELAARILALPGDRDGLTLSGGEPMLQAPALLQLVRRLRAERPTWTFMSYTGYLRSVLERRGSEGQRALLGELDLLVDGPFVARRAEGTTLWRGSSNQRIHALTPAGRRALQGYDLDRPGITEYVLDDGALRWTGIPPAGFRTAETEVPRERALTWTQVRATSGKRVRREPDHRAATASPDHDHEEQG
ncbi:MAG: 4Fe-4S single cluster domain-containing protein [Solirubrobacteraceae bacterium]|nr:4Fe-4S single cluster domain-containing protein [Patulibacter sp.]